MSEIVDSITEQLRRLEAEEVRVKRAAHEVEVAIGEVLAFLADARLGDCETADDLRAGRIAILGLVSRLGYDPDGARSQSLWTTLVRTAERLAQRDADIDEFYSAPSPFDERDEEVTP